MKIRLSIAIATALMLACECRAIASIEPPTTAGGRRIVRSVQDLPQRTYKLDATAEEIFADTCPALDELAEQLLRDVRHDLELLKIEDDASQRLLHVRMTELAIFRGNFRMAYEHVNRAAALQPSERSRAARGHILRAIIASQDGMLHVNEEMIYTTTLNASIRRAPRATTHQFMRDFMLRTESATKETIRKSMIAGFHDRLDRFRGKFPEDAAHNIIAAANQVRVLARYVEPTRAVFRQLLAEHAITATDLWTPRTTGIDAPVDGTPVLVAIFDSGVDAESFPTRMWSNPAESHNGLDDDSNGITDDVQGIGFASGMSDDSRRIIAAIELDRDRSYLFFQTAEDLRSGIETPDVLQYAKYLNGAPAQEVTKLRSFLSEVGKYVHGTHVAGIAAEGNPFIRIADIRHSNQDGSDGTTTCECRAEKFAEVAAFIKSHHVRVVNMSWSFSFKNVLDSIRAEHPEASATEQDRLATECLAIRKLAIVTMIQQCPGTLFVACAGNNADDTVFQDAVPAGLDLPNLVVVGSTDSQDDISAFSSTGKNVRFYACGEQIESLFPGGVPGRLSGTSTAAPHFTNLAARLLAAHPELSPTEVIELIRASADPLPGHEGCFIINPRRTLETLSP